MMRVGDGSSTPNEGWVERKKQTLDQTGPQ